MEHETRFELATLTLATCCDRWIHWCLRCVPCV